MAGPKSEGAPGRAGLARGPGLVGLVAPLPRYLPALGVVGLLVCMLVPLPTALVDLLLSLSLALGALLLVVCLGIRRSTDFLAFPSLLLLATLLRLALNVQTTRLILADADAGAVIEAFASLVVRGDMIVGAVIFAIITAVNYLVITRGAERVAEVAARFALDGLPGQQGAIDADLRSGAISAHEAARRRAALLERSSFYGAMDGAVRFVKGDAVAGLAITAINLVGGATVGALERGLGLGESVAMYGRLTIGDGLVAQIPALLVSLAAGVLVARVDRQGEGAARPLEWLEPTALLFPAGLLGGLALIEGMPRGAFAAAALGLVAGGLWLAGRRPAGGRAPAGIRVLRPAEDGDLRALRRALAEVQRRCAAALGVAVPEVSVEAAPGLPRGALEVRYGERTLAAREGVAAGEDAAVVEVFRVLMASGELFFDLHALEEAIEGLRSERPAIVREALRVLGLPEVLALCHGLLRERIPLPPLGALLGAIAGDRRFAAASERPRWLELCREHMAGFWVRDLLVAYARLGPLTWVRLDPEAEAEVTARAFDAAGTPRPIAAGEREGWVRGARAAAEGAAACVVLTSPRGRAGFAAMAWGAAPFLPVLSTAELAAAGVPEPDAAAVRWLAGSAAGEA